MIISDLHSAIFPLLRDIPQGQLFVLVDTHTQAYCLPIFSDAIGEVSYHLLTIEAGEKSKNLTSVQVVWDFFFKHRATREAVLINLGGGMITDLGGFAAATYMRGIRFVNIPTTLLAMVDASSGGKTGFDYQGIKNAIGTFTHPLETLIYPDFLRSLPTIEWFSGYAEMLKHGLLSSVNHFNLLLSLDLNDAQITIPSELLVENISVKSHIVALDPTEKGLRKALNFGHTIGHAIEEMYYAQSRRVTHGYCVMWGMVAELYLSVVLLGFPKTVLTQMSHMMIAHYGRPECNCQQRSQLIEWMRRDKKNVQSNTINFTLLSNVGVPMINQIVSENDITEAIEYLFSL